MELGSSDPLLVLVLLLLCLLERLFSLVWRAACSSALAWSSFAFFCRSCSSSSNFLFFTRCSACRSSLSCQSTARFLSCSCTSWAVAHRLSGLPGCPQPLDQLDHDDGSHLGSLGAVAGSGTAAFGGVAGFAVAGSGTAAFGGVAGTFVGQVDSSLYLATRAPGWCRSLPCFWAGCPD